MDDYTSGLELVNQTVSTVKGVLGLAKEAKTAVKNGDEEADEKIDALREKVHSALDQLIQVKAEHLALLERNLEMQKAVELRNGYTLKQVGSHGTEYAYVPTAPEPGLEDLMLCKVCFEQSIKSPLAVDSDGCYARCECCKNVYQLAYRELKQPTVSRGRNPYTR